MRRYTGCPSSLHLAFYVLAANADLRRPGSQRAREDVGAAFPCASTYYNGGQRIEKTRFAAGARGRVAYVAGLEHTGHHLWHEGVFKQPGPWRNAYGAYAVGDRAKTCADDAKLAKALRADLARTQGDVLLHLPSCSYPCGTPPATWDPDLPWLAAATEAAPLLLTKCEVVPSTAPGRKHGCHAPWDANMALMWTTLGASLATTLGSLPRLEPRAASAASGRKERGFSTHMLLRRSSAYVPRRSQCADQRYER